MKTRKQIPVAWMKVYDASDNYLAACVEVESAAAVVALSGSGATIRNGHSRKKAVWVEGGESQSAAESYDFVAITIHERTTAPSPEGKERNP